MSDEIEEGGRGKNRETAVRGWRAPQGDSKTERERQSERYREGERDTGTE